MRWLESLGQAIAGVPSYGRGGVRSYGNVVPKRWESCSQVPGTQFTILPMTGAL